MIHLALTILAFCFLLFIVLPLALLIGGLILRTETGKIAVFFGVVAIAVVGIRASASDQGQVAAAQQHTAAVQACQANVTARANAIREQAAYNGTYTVAMRNKIDYAASQAQADCY